MEAIKTRNITAEILKRDYTGHGISDMCAFGTAKQISALMFIWLYSKKNKCSLSLPLPLSLYITVTAITKKRSLITSDLGQEKSTHKQS
jgi:hypothetical protein